MAKSNYNICNVRINDQQYYNDSGTLEITEVTTTTTSDYSQFIAYLSCCIGLSVIFVARLMYRPMHTGSIGIFSILILCCCMCSIYNYNNYITSDDQKNTITNSVQSSSNSVSYTHLTLPTSDLV